MRHCSYARSPIWQKPGWRYLTNLPEAPRKLRASLEANRMKRIAIIGGGISGLSAAFYLEKARAAGVELEYTLVESGQRLGGCMSSDRIEGCLVEAGPDSFLTEKPWASALCQELGIADQLIGSNDSQ